MTNLGIVIGVSNYPPGVGDLQACATDAAAITVLLDTESKFDHLLIISENTNSSTVKQQLTDFVAQHKDQSIDEVFFYYTGHGDFANDEFYYILSDYDPKRRRQTSFENTEIDSLLKALSPKTVVKLIDACHSGVTYIKDSRAFDAYLKGTGATFKKCYFLFSSQVDQSSYQDASLSFFTRAVVDAVLAHDYTELRYKDVIDFVSDTFSSDLKQTPFFVVQADFTETFCTVTPTLKSMLRSVIDRTGTPTVKPAPPVLSLTDRVRMDAERYCTEADTQEAVERLRYELSSVQCPADLEGLFSITVQNGSEVSFLPDATTIGNWLSQNQHAFFAEPYYRTVTVKKRKPKNPLLLGIASLGMLDDDAYRIVEEAERQVCGFKTTVDMPYLYLLLKADPVFPNIIANDCFIIPIVSKTEIRLFYTFCQYRDVGWDKRQREHGFKWITQSFQTKDKDALSDAVSIITDKLWSFIREQLESRFGLPEPLSEADSDLAVEDVNRAFS